MTQGGASQAGAKTAGGSTSTGGQPGTAGSPGGTNAGGSAGGGGAIASGGNATGAAGGTNTGGAPSSIAALAVLTDTNRDGVLDADDSAGFTDWTWQGMGAFFIANVDDDDEKGKTDASDQIVNGPEDEQDLARLLIRVSAAAMTDASGITVAVTAGGANTHLFEKTDLSWVSVSGPLSRVAPEIELGIEATRFADASWDGKVSIRVELSGSGQSSTASQEVTLQVAPWIMLPQSAKTELLYISDSTSSLRADLDRTLESAGLSPAVASSPGQQDIWFQDTMEIGYTQLPGKQPMHVVMQAQRPNASDDVAITLLAPNFGFISIGMPRQPGDEEDHWMDWTGNLEVTHPVPAYPLGRIYYGKSDRTTFHPTILAFLEAQRVQKPFAVYTNWLLIQHVDEIMNFLPDEDGKAKMIIVSPSAASTVTGSGLDDSNAEIQGYIEAEIAQAKTELGLSDGDIIELPVLFEGGGSDWSNPVNSVLAGNTFMIGETNTPASVKADVEQKLAAIGIQVAWVDDSEYHPGGGNVHCGTNTKKTPVCPNFTACLP
jgi:protein-arginine deiminase